MERRMMSIESITACDVVNTTPTSRWLRITLAAALGVMVVGCGSSSKGSTGDPSPPPNPSQLYFAPHTGSSSLATFAIDQTAGTYARSTYGAAGATITDSGVISDLSNGVVSLNTTYIYGTNGSVTLQNPLKGSWAVGLPDEAALVELNIPSVTTSQGYQIPAMTSFAPAVPTQ